MTHKLEQSTPTIAKMMPSLSLDAEDLPQIKDWKVGGKYNVVAASDGQWRLDAVGVEIAYTP